MKKLIYILLLLFSSLISCKEEFLDKAPLDIITDAAVWSDNNYVNAVLTNLYGKAPFDGIFRNFYVWGPDGYAISPSEECYLSDEARVAYSWEQSYIAFNKGFITRDMAPVSYWDYKLVRDINEFLKKIEPSNLEAGIKKIKKGEARFLRAFVYFEMTKRYGGVPLITKAQDISEGDALFVERAKEKDVYDFIIAECDSAANVLPEKFPDPEFGRATKYAALALKSRAALYAASIAKYGQVQLNGLVGIPAGEASKYFQLSYDASKAIVDSKKYNLFNKYPTDKVKNYASIFTEEGHSEIIFARLFVPKDRAHNFDFFNMPHGLKTVGWGSAINPTLEMINEYEMVDGSSGVINFTTQTSSLTNLFKNKDPRFLASIFYNGSKWKADSARFYNGVYSDRNNDGVKEFYNERGKVVPGTTIAQIGAGIAHNDATKSGFVIKKFLKESLTITSARNESDQDWPVFRLAEIYLNQAEAAFELGKSADALTAINEVRNRAGIAAQSSLDIDKIRHERKVELAFEAHRYWDMRRWRIAESVLNGVKLKGLEPYWNIDNNTYTYKIIDCDGYARVFRPHFNYLPISNTMTNNNPKLLENPGY